VDDVRRAAAPPGAGCARAACPSHAASAQIGVLGWIIVTPMLIGMFAGRWLDHHFGTGLFWTAPLLMLGAALGCWSAWRWMKSA
jgi:predicted F0F1-ATPase subunit